MKEYVVNKESNTKHFHSQFKVKDSKKRIIRGWASTKYEDRDREIIEPEAIRQSLEIFKMNPVVLRDHDMRRPVGKMVYGDVNETGFWIEAEIATGTKDADETWALIEQDVLRAISIGFIAKEYDAKERKIKQLELLEFSVVSIPSNRQSLFSIAKAFDLGTDLIECEQTDRKGLDRRFELMVKEFEFFIAMRKDGHLPEKFKTKLDGILELHDSLTRIEFAEDLSDSKSQLERLALEIEIAELELL